LTTQDYANYLWPHWIQNLRVWSTYDLSGSRIRRYTSRLQPYWIKNPAHKIKILQGLSYSKWLSRPCHTSFFKENQVHNYMHARIKFHAYSWQKWITVQYHVRKGRLSEFTLNLGNGGSKHHRQSTGGCVRLALHNIFTSSSCSSFLFLSNVYSKGEHLSYSTSVGKIWMQRLYSGLGYKHLAFLVGQILLAPDY
jgi:hypothetical protein